MRTLILFITLLCCFSLSAQNYQRFYLELLQQKNTLVSALSKNKKIPDYEIVDISFGYVQGVGAYFHLIPQLPLQKWLADQATSNTELTLTENNNALPPKSANFTELRQLAKALSHQAYALERKIKSMKKGIPELSKEKKDEVTAHIIEAEQELSEVNTQKEKLKPQYERAKQRVSTNNSNTNMNDHIADFEQKLTSQLCQAPTLMPYFAEAESITFVLKQWGIQVDEHYQDISYNFSPHDISQCINGEISPQDLLNTAVSHAF
ncbi:hypothetical protein AAD001_11075 [Colwelliaceae bacterium 6471]